MCLGKVSALGGGSPYHVHAGRNIANGRYLVKTGAGGARFT